MICVLPGMGADARMFPAPWRRLPDSVFPGWGDMDEKESISSVAEEITNRNGIRDGDILIGSSLGGMVAAEIAKIRQIKMLFLVGSARGPEELNGILRHLRSFARELPIRVAQETVAPFAGQLGAMFRDADPRFVRNMTKAIFEWRGLPDGITEIHRIHGRHDGIIPPPRDNCELVDGGHLIAMTHAEECVRIVERRLR
jgi:pimeloyl-ACP methyl ester carboxylesterase